MKVWHVTYTAFGFNCDAVVVHVDRGNAIAALCLGRECQQVEAHQIGTALSETPYVVCDYKLEVA